MKIKRPTIIFNDKEYEQCLTHKEILKAIKRGQVYRTSEGRSFRQKRDGYEMLYNLVCVAFLATILIIAWRVLG